MLNTSDYLIPLRFGTLVLQTVFTVSAFFARVSNFIILILYFLIKLQKSNIDICDDIKHCENYVEGFSIVLFITEIIEFVIQFLGITLFLNKLSLLQIMFHTIATMLYLWYIFLDWEGSTIWVIWFLGSLIPFLLEAGGILYSYLFYIKVLRLN